MIFLRKFNDHTSYEAEINRGGVDISLPNVSYCKDIKDIHYTPYNFVRFYVGEISGTTPQTVKIYTDLATLEEVQVSEGNKWYGYAIPKDKELYKISGDSVTKVTVKADITTSNTRVIPNTIIEASFKGSNTSNVTNMKSMFVNCRNLTSLDVSSFDTSKVTSMESMFYGCSGLTSLDLRNFNTSNVTHTTRMFYGCSSLTSLDVSSFYTSNVISMNYMFYDCASLKSLNLSNFNTSNVTNMAYMFGNCSGLTSLNLSNFDTSKVVGVSNMFNGCVNLKTITMIGCGQTTIDKIEAQLTKDNITGFTIVTK